jgi:hypothetical protein
MMRRGAASRGQALVLFALTLLFVVSLACVTLSFGLRTKQKMELQTLADAAAYSNAVAVARTYNSMAVINRALLASLVAAAGAQSLISYTSMVHAVAGATFEGLRELTRENPACESLKEKASLLERISEGDFANFDQRDRLAAEQVRRLNLHQLMLEYHRDLDDKGGPAPRFKRKLGPLITGRYRGGRVRRLADLVLEQSGRPPGVRASHAVDAINGREIDPFGHLGFGKLPSTYKPDRLPWAELEVVMGSRGHPFVTGRRLEDGSHAASLVETRVQEFLHRVDLAGKVKVGVRNYAGSGYFNDALQPTHGRAPVPSEMGKDDGAVKVINFHDWNADDHADVEVTVEWDGCRGSYTTHFDPTLPMNAGNGGAWSFVHTSLSSEEDNHRWSFGRDTILREANHTMVFDKDRDTWPRTFEYPYWKLAEPADLYGQPKSYALLERDLSGLPAMPWELRVNGVGPFRDAKLDLRAPPRQAAVATGLAYYHRAGDWREPPNMLNPFWRATLAPIDVDPADSASDVPEVLSAVGPLALETFERLRREGFRGLH